MLSDTIAGARLKLVEVPTGFSDSDDGNRQVVAFYESLQRGEDLLIGEISGSAEEYESIGVGSIHVLVIARTMG